MKIPVRDVSSLSFLVRCWLRLKRPQWAMDPISGNFYGFVTYKGKLYLMYENEYNRNYGNA